ncbi:MAG: NADH-quinone oxidoreductase subunit J [Elusimicrobia bacterium]|nr:NADH-quinone oxidoreductase subunit J [Elusimicrobiota bacterium]
MREICFYLAGAGAVFFSALMLFQRGLYAGAACLLGALLQVGVLLYLAGSPLVGFLQVVIYAGGVMALIVVAVMSAPADDRDAAMWGVFSVPRPLVAGSVLLLGVELALACAGGGAPGAVGATGALDKTLGNVLFGPYALATEAAALLLFVAALALVSGPQRRAR